MRKLGWGGTGCTGGYGLFSFIFTKSNTGTVEWRKSIALAVCSLNDQSSIRKAEALMSAVGFIIGIRPYAIVKGSGEAKVQTESW